MVVEARHLASDACGSTSAPPAQIGPQHMPMTANTNAAHAQHYSYSYSPEELGTLRGIFSLHDTSSAGFITPKSLETLLEKMNRTVCVDDLPRDNRITFRAFLHVLAQHARQNGSGDDDGNNMRYIQIIEEHRQLSVKRGEYLQAEEAAKQLVELRKQEEMRRQHLATANKASDRAKIQAAHQKQYLEYSRHWDEFMEDFDRKSMEYVAEAKDRQAQELSEFQDKMVEDMQSKPIKWSHELIHWRKRQHVMAEQKNYADAQQIKAIADDMEEEELENMNSRFTSSFQKKEAAFRQRQAAEIQALLKRVDVRRKELEQQRAYDSKRLIQRNRNVIAGMESKGSIDNAKTLDQIKIALRNEMATIRDDATKGLA
eukprot:CAMPEP_0181048740 /NCGR_PEP_ID=MMETSP1070-20121207/15598_1 /TAXON_ID=265543 /ORGANISM="Minutocellus polymorphus, Strain NH13" /LENGTH=371 /DNA_ID=CAMNT_0023127547 /DNA_START=307 /DNA_END=1422 /DNA_ORIENTATION=-